MNPEFPTTEIGVNTTQPISLVVDYSRLQHFESSWKPEVERYSAVIAGHVQSAFPNLPINEEVLLAELSGLPSIAVIDRGTIGVGGGARHIVDNMLGAIRRGLETAGIPAETTLSEGAIPNDPRTRLMVRQYLDHGLTSRQESILRYYVRKIEQITPNKRHTTLPHRLLRLLRLA